MNVTDKLFHPPQKRLRDYIALAVDTSSSMAQHGSRAYDMVREQFENIGSLQQDPQRDVYLNHYTFATQVTPLVTNKVNKINVPERSRYIFNGWTALNDAFAKSIEDLEAYDTGSQNASFLVVVITDGQENRSHISTSTLRSIIAAKTARDNWTFVLIGTAEARGYADELGIPQGNVMVWDATQVEEYERTSTALIGQTSKYSSMRASGATSTRSFFTDASAITPQVAAKSLGDITHAYRSIAATKQGRIDDFVRYHAGSFEKGVTEVYYQLTKPEKVQESKLIVLRDKVTRKIYGGDVRAKLGLPASGEIRLKPGNHAGWDIFVQSKSDNRLLSRGQLVLIKK